MSEAYAGKQVVGIDLHRRRSVIVRMTESGERLETVRILNDRDRLADVMGRAGESPEVVLEATYGRGVWDERRDGQGGRRLGRRGWVNRAHSRPVRPQPPTAVRGPLPAEHPATRERGCRATQRPGPRRASLTPEPTHSSLLETSFRPGVTAKRRLGTHGWVDESNDP
jgi:hypothetical protein